MSNKEQTPRQHALEVIKNGGCVVVDDTVYTLVNINQLPPEEAFLIGDDKGLASTIKTLEEEKKALEARLAALATSTKKKDSEKVEPIEAVAEEVKDEKKSK